MSLPSFTSSPLAAGTLDAEQQYRGQRNDTGFRVREAIVLAIGLQNAELNTFIIDHSNFADSVINSLVRSFALLPGMENPKASHRLLAPSRWCTSIQT